MTTTGKRTARTPRANRGVERNKKLLQNILIWIENGRPDSEGNKTYILLWAYERDYNKGQPKNFSGPITAEKIKSKLTIGQWCKFCQGERFFVIQRRIDGRNIPKRER